MKKERKNQSELQKLMIFLGVLLVLLVISFFVGMYLGPEVETEQKLAKKQTLTAVTAESPAKSEDPGEESVLDIYKEAKEIRQSISAKPKPKEKPPKKNKLSAVKQKKTAKASPKAKKESIVYSVQVGAFRSAKEAKRLAKKLKGKGYDVYVVDVDSKDKGILHKIRIGHFSKRSQADALSKKIRKREGIQAFVAYR